MASQTIQHIENGSGSFFWNGMTVALVSYMPGGAIDQLIRVTSINLPFSFTPRYPSSGKSYGCEFRIDVPNIEINFSVGYGSYPSYFDFDFYVYGVHMSFRSTDSYAYVVIPWSNIENFSGSSVITNYYISVDGGDSELVNRNFFLSPPYVLNVTFNNSIQTDITQTITYELWGKLLASTANEKFQFRAISNGVIIETLDFPYTRTGSISWTPALATYAPLYPESYSNCPLTLAFARVKLTSSAIYSVYYTDISLTLSAYYLMPQISYDCADGYPDKPSQFGSNYLTGVSCFKITPHVTTQYGASLQSIKIEAVGNTYQGFNDVPTITDTITNLVSDKIIVVTATDSRGLTSTSRASLPITILRWAPPVLTKLEVRRGYYNSSTHVFTPNDNGDYCDIVFQASWSPVNNLNVASAVLTYPASTTPAHIPVSNYAIDGDFISAADTETSYEITLAISDLVTTVMRTIRLSTAGVVFDVKSGGSGLGLGKVAEYSDCVEINPEWDFRCYGMTLADYIRSIVQQMN